MKYIAVFLFAFVFLSNAGICARAPVSEATEECLGCHSSIHPGIVAQWEKSRHAMISPQKALVIKGPGRKISVTKVPAKLMRTSVGCAECHMLRAKDHMDSFDHNGVEIHVVVSPDDCATCHKKEAEEYGENIMANAIKNLADNEVYQLLQRTIIGTPVFDDDGSLTYKPADDEKRAESCFYCHGTNLKLKGMETRDTVLGEMEFPKIEGWPNQGVGRINLDESMGSCTPCHTRHTFSIEMARKPDTCKECHEGPDVPAFKAYKASKHGSIYSSMKKKWNFSSVPWIIGKDFTAPTCAACHISMLANTDGEIIAQRTHKMSDRLSWRLFGLIIAHPHPIEPDTTKIKNKDGLQLPADFDGGLASSFLIDGTEQKKRAGNMQAICKNCHSGSWVNAHWDQFEKTIEDTNNDVLTATKIMREIWHKGYAQGLEKGKNPFDESIERMWCDSWLFYANTVRFASAMCGGGDYVVFADGRYQLSRRTRQLYDWLRLQKRLFPQSAPVAIKDNFFPAFAMAEKKKIPEKSMPGHGDLPQTRRR